jgi:hypothetical protein
LPLVRLDPDHRIDTGRDPAAKGEVANINRDDIPYRRSCANDHECRGAHAAQIPDAAQSGTARAQQKRLVAVSTVRLGRLHGTPNRSEGAPACERFWKLSKDRGGAATPLKRGG